MPRTKKVHAHVITQGQSASDINGPATEVMTLPEAAAYLRLSEPEVLRLIDEQALPARRLGKELRFLKSAIQQWLSAPTPLEPGKTAQMAVAGSWKDDPLVEQELIDALRRRGRTRGGR
jgi:excisionase family DNA binding protein